MATPDPRSPKGTRPPNGAGDPNFNWRGLVLFAIAIALIGGAFIFKGGPGGNVKEISYPDFLDKLKAGEIDRTKGLELISKPSTATDYLKGQLVTPPDARVMAQINLEYDRNLKSTLEDQFGVKVSPKTDTDVLGSVVLGFLPIALFLLILYFFFRQQIRMAGKGALNFGKSKARMLARDKNKITFKDVAGADEAQEEVQEIVEFLRDPKKFQKLGGRIPKGVLMVGPPGTGKTLLARAIAGEADVPFFSISGSDFVEMFVGVGASRVRDMFEQGKKSAPCIIFIDEIDAVGRQRGAGLGGGNDEREQTLNQMLVEMDGFETNLGVIVVAATNRPDILDAALLRPGRFDRQVYVQLPDIRGREQILNVHMRKIPIGQDVAPAIIARGTPGMSGADLANLCNEAALMAARRNARVVEMQDFEKAKDKIFMGPERKSMVMPEEERRNTAYHEAGHALLGKMLPKCDPVHKVTIIPRGRALGVTMSLPEKDRYSYDRDYMLNQISMLFGGRIAEEVFMNQMTTGASNDFERATHLARDMVMRYGMTDALGPMVYAENEGEVFLGRSVTKTTNISEQTMQKVDAEVRRIIDEQYGLARKLIEDNSDKMHAMAKAL
ncbi:MAG TPA: ATP-dependent zinc metalloprotease FtsH, partial [Chthoniobacteraceae bacterium]